MPYYWHDVFFSISIGFALAIGLFPITVPLLIGAGFGSKFFLQKVLKINERKVNCGIAVAVVGTYIIWSILLGLNAQFGH